MAHSYALWSEPISNGSADQVGWPPESKAADRANEGDLLSRNSVIRYRTRPDAAEENVRLVEAVYAALAEARPPDFEYATFRLDDGATFVHVARLPDNENPLAALPAFADFQRGLAERCVEQPAPSGATLVGSYPDRS